MRKSKRELVKLAGGCLLASIVCAVINLGTFAAGLLITCLTFTAWLLLLVYRDHLLSQDVPHVRADYQRPPEVMSKGSRGLPTSFE